MCAAKVLYVRSKSSVCARMNGKLVNGKNHHCRGVFSVFIHFINSTCQLASVERKKRMESENNCHLSIVGYQ